MSTVPELERKIETLRKKAKLILTEVIKERNGLRKEVASLKEQLAAKDEEIAQLKQNAGARPDSQSGDSSGQSNSTEEQAQVLKETLKKHKEVIEQQRRELDQLREHQHPQDLAKGKKFASKNNLKAKFTKIKKSYNKGTKHHNKKEHAYASRVAPPSSTGRINTQRERNPNEPPMITETPMSQIPEFNDKYVIFDLKDNSLKGASLDRLIVRLTRKDDNEPLFQRIFLLTYRSYCTPPELVDKLVELWTKLTVEKYSEKDVEVMRMRFSQFLKIWMERHWYDFSDNAQGIENVKDFINSTLSLALPLAASTLQQLIANKVSEAVKVREVFMSPPSSRVPPGPITDLNDIDTLELARQLALMDQAIYREIKPRECMNQAWSKVERQPQAPNLMKFINRFNTVSAMVRTVIVSESNLRKRKLLLVKFIKLAQKLRELHDFHTLMAILAALSNAAVSRLKKTWEGVASNHQSLLENMQQLMSSEGSYRAFRGILKAEDPPSVPWVGVYLADLTFIEDGNSEYLDPVEDEKIINYQRMKMMAEVINEIKFYQQDRYGLRPVPEIQKYIDGLCKQTKDEKLCYNLSLKVEPRQQS